MTALTATAIAPAHEPGFASRRLHRLLSLSLSITTILNLIAMGPVIPEESLVVGAPYSCVAVGAIGLPAMVTLVLFFTAPLGALRAIWRLQAIGMLLLCGAIPLVLVQGLIPRGPNSFWMFEFETIAGCAAALAWRARTLIMYVIAMQMIMFTIGISFGEGSIAGPVTGDAARNLVTMAMFTALAVALLRAGRLLDATIEAAITDAAFAAQGEVKRASQRTVEMLIHDRIIVALLAYASGAEAARSAAEARTALAAMKTATEARGQSTATIPRDLAWDMQALTTQLDAEAHFEYTVEGEAALPQSVSAAVIEALSEALRNSIRHATKDAVVSREVRATVSSDQLEVIVLDNGIGFDAAAVRPARLGITHGIIRRMESVPGGGADVRSKIGYGTMVALHWNRQ